MSGNFFKCYSRSSTDSNPGFLPFWVCIQVSKEIPWSQIFLEEKKQNLTFI